MDNKDKEVGENQEQIGEFSHPNVSDGVVTKGSPKPINWNPGDPTDGRRKYECESVYPIGCRIEIFAEALYLTVLMLIAAYLLIWYCLLFTSFCQRWGWRYVVLLFTCF